MCCCRFPARSLARSYEGEDDGDEEDFKLKEQLRRATRCRVQCANAMCGATYTRQQPER